jgi:16S rRNA processing protein RimM
MEKRFLEAGKIVNTHGINGEVKIIAWADSPEFLCGFEYLYLDQKPYVMESYRIHKGSVLAKLQGVNDINAAMSLKNKVVYIDREKAELPEGSHFIVDLIGMEVRNATTGEVLGRLSEILTLPSSRVYVVTGERNYMIPAVDEFLVETNIEQGFIRVNLIEGFEC